MTKIEKKHAQGILLLCLLAGATLVALLPMAIADPVAPTNLTVGESSRRNLSSLVADPINALAGNVTNINITALSITNSWQGYYGNVSGTILLADANNNSLYEWNHDPPAGEIYATRNSSISWSTINCSNASTIAAEESYLGQAASDADSVTNTFTGTGHPDFFTGHTNISGCPATNTFVDSTAQSGDFHAVMLADGSGNVAYATIIDANTTGYDNRTHDFQMLVGENGHEGDTAATPYYFYIELGAN